MTQAWNTSSTVSPRPNVVACELEGENVLLNLDTSRYYRLNAVGSQVWNELAAPRRVAELHQAILDRFDVDQERVARDVDALLSDLSNSGLIDIADGQAA